MVLNARGVNQRFAAPRKPRLGSSSALAGLVIPEGEQLYIATGDIQDCFYCMESPEWLWPFFSLLRVTRQEGLELGLVNENWSASHVAPQFKVLPMGWSLSAYYCQAAHEHIVMQTGVVAAEDNLADFGPAPALTEDRCVWLGYIDTSFVASLDPKTTERARLAIDDEFRRRK